MRVAARAKSLEVAEEIVAEIKLLAPVDTGRLKMGYHAEARSRGAVIVNDVYYWKYVEYGTSRNEAQPHVRPAIELVKLRKKAT